MRVDPPKTPSVDPCKAVTRWLTGFVIAERLCPFAAAPWRRGAVRIVGEKGGVECALARLIEEAQRVLDDTADADATTLLVLTNPAFTAFEDYLDLIELGDGLIDAQALRGRVQLASFHPHYRFAGEPADDPAHHSNRSPWPLLHLLREDAVSRAVDGHADPDGIPTRNVAHLRALGHAEILRRACTPPTTSAGDPT